MNLLKEDYLLVCFLLIFLYIDFLFIYLLALVVKVADGECDGLQNEDVKINNAWGIVFNPNDKSLYVSDAHSIKRINNNGMNDFIQI